jgi:hypothetical protein
MTDSYEHFIGTRPVSDKHAFDVAALTAWLEKNLPGFRGRRTCPASAVR